jgi:G:T/U-mismatch repair DNA glycosylase
MPSDTNAKWRVRIAFLCLFVVFVVLSIGAYYLTDLSRLQDRVAARESQAALQGITDPAQIDEALRKHPSNRFLRMLAMAIRAADETDAAGEKLSNEVEQPAIPTDINLGAASRNELEALRRNLKTAEANAKAFMPRYAALLKSERDKVEKDALSLHVEKETLGRLLQRLDQRHAEMTAFTSSMMSARAEFYRAYENYVAVLAREFGAYKVVDGQFIFPFQLTVDRYNVAATAMTVATKRIVELAEERKGLLKSQQAAWVRFVNGK